jgi:hypothetical protein
VNVGGLAQPGRSMPEAQAMSHEKRLAPGFEWLMIWFLQ